MTSPAGDEPKHAVPDRTVAQFTVQFEYFGSTGLTAFGAATGRRYRFEGPGSRVAVHPRDRPGLALVPKLRQVT